MTKMSKLPKLLIKDTLRGRGFHGMGWGGGGMGGSVGEYIF